MKYLVLLMMFVLAGCQVAESNPKSTEGLDNELFPIYGVTLGKSTREDLIKLAGKKDRKNDFYTIKGQRFWFDEEGKYSSSMYMTTSEEMPKKWMDLGFSWYLSYNQWLALLRKLGFTVTVAEPPEIQKYEGHDSFHALVNAVKLTGIPVQLTLDFSYSEETSADAESTLYSISITLPEE